MSQSSQVLVINSGSSSIKYSLLEMPACQVLLEGVIETPHAKQSVHRLQTFSDKRDDANMNEQTLVLGSIEESCQHIYQVLSAEGWSANVSLIAHRVVHGGEKYQQATPITDSVAADLQQLSQLAPLHNRDNLAAINCFKQLYPTVLQVAVFDTAFHSTLPEVAYRYAIPETWFQQLHIRRYGFHGTSHQYVATEAARLLEKPLETLNLISLHLGNGASVCAIRQGCSVDTSMGFTPLEGLMMGTRSGDLDAAIPLFIQQATGQTAEQVQFQLEHDSGLKALAGTHDMRELLRREKAGDTVAQFAVNAFVYRIQKYIGAYFAVLGRVDAVIFTGGVGENSADIRARCCEGLSVFGLAVDPQRNAEKTARFISAESATPAILTIATNEALQIARLSLPLLASQPKV